MAEHSNFIKTIIKEDLASGKHKKIITRFPPEPNGYLHIGHTKAIITNFEFAKEFKGQVNLRFDDTNPIKEDLEYVNAIKEDIKWLGYKWDNLFFASDYFDTMYEKAVLLIKKGLAFVCDLTIDEIREYKGSFTEPGKDSPYRNRSIEENLTLFEEMKSGKYKDGEKVLRAKIDMSSPNINLRDPVIYRISHTYHHNTKDKWCIYPMYDYAHPLEDAIEGITHSICTLEFEDHRPLYDWYVKNCEMKYIPRQIEFGKLVFKNTITSKRFLRKAVEDKVVSGWDDPRLPTVKGLRRRGYTKEAIFNCIRETGLSKNQGVSDIAMLEHYLREDLKPKVDRLMSVVDPIKVTITNYDGKSELLEIANNSDRDESTRKISFSNILYINRDDFEEVKPNKKWKRLSLGIEVRLMGAYFIKANEVIKDKNGKIIEILATYDKATKSGSGFNERKPNGTIHFVDANNCINAKAIILEDLLHDNDKDYFDRINKDSYKEIDIFVESNLSNYKESDRFQFVRDGYYILDDKKTNTLIRTVSLKSSFKK